MLVNTVINCGDSLIIKIVFLKDNCICHIWKKTSPKAITASMRCFKEQTEIIILTPLYLHHGIFPFFRLTTKGAHSFIIFTTPKRWRWQFESSCLGVLLYTVALCYCCLMSSITLSFGRRWGEYWTPWFYPFYPPTPRHYGEYLLTYRWVRVMPW